MTKHPPIRTLENISTLEKIRYQDRTSLLDILDRVLEKGVVGDGEVAIRLADIDLIYIGVRLLVTSVSKAQQLRGRGGNSKKVRTKEEHQYLKILEEEIKRIEQRLPRIINADNPKKAEQGIAKLVLTLVELIRRLLERESMRRIDSGDLSKAERQKLGLTLKALEKKVEELKAVFGIKEDLNLDLGPLGNLM
mgnify:FL=1